MPRHIELPGDELRLRYLAGQSTVTLAADFGCSPTTVAKRLHALGVALRPSRFNPLPIPEAELRRLYEGERLSITQIAAHFGVSTSTIANKRRSYGIAIRPRREGVKG